MNVDRLCIVQAYCTVALVVATVTKLSEGLVVELIHMLSFPSLIVPLLYLPSAPSVVLDPDELALRALAALHTTAGGRSRRRSWWWEGSRKGGGDGGDRWWWAGGRG